ncbi:double-strand break repair protein AddB [Chachezhania antarctica]|uniref:double-strand break repair protein AddB n=1 Tax=Chachezhania antarctica TaxID=2340860 RepID=UPI000EAE1637|nr:double-strand break repair protein AddB [Chachezhania antarctica]
MFEPDILPRVFALPPGADVPAEIVSGLTARHQGPPEALARVELMVNTRRMARRIRAIFDDGPALLLPQLSLVTDPGLSPALADLPLSVPPLRRRLELVQLIRALLDQQPDLASRAALFDLADSLAALMEEMQGEGVSPDTISGLDVSDMSGHWARALQFIGIARTLMDTDTAPEAAGRQRMAVEQRIAAWQANPPQHPVIVAGSTGSRGTTLMLMEAVARLPQGALVLPGFDFDQPARIWSSMDDALAAEDHPQYRFRRIMDVLGIGPGDVRPWTDTPAPAPARNRLVSLALRPAPVTHAWLSEGPKLDGLGEALENVTLVEAPGPRAEAMAIAMRLRKAAEDGTKAALITPDRMLTRQVAAALAQWGIEPDDSAGMPLQLSPPGRFLRQVAQLFARPLTGAALIALLKHPLTHSGEGRGIHLLLTRDLELQLRRHGPAFPDPAALIAWAEKMPERRGVWAQWLITAICPLFDPATASLEDWTDRLLSASERIAGGSVAEGSGGLWDKNAGKKARAVVDLLAQEAPAGGDLSATEFSDLLGALLGEDTVRDRDAAHPGIMIWGTLEARVMGADLLILGGLNEGSWPEVPAPDPWLNRAMRKEAGLLLPERRVGLSAHDFQQAIGAREVWLTRAERSDDADTVLSRWVNRLTNLLGGLRNTDGPKLLNAMRERGRHWLQLAEALETPAHIDPAHRPAPRPPVDARPKQYRVTEIRTLIRDPYAIYARKVLGLQPLDPLVQEAEASDRGTVIHKVFERFIKDTPVDELTPERLLACADAELANVPWPAARRLWRAKLARIADDVIRAEHDRQKLGQPGGFEVKAEDHVTAHAITLTGRADRIDRAEDGRLLLYDYKTGHVPTQAEQKGFDKQLLIEAAMAERGAFDGFPAAPVAAADYIGVGAKYKTEAAPLADIAPAEVWEDLGTLMEAYLEVAQGFTSRRAMRKDTDSGDYDHLARFGEWDVTATAKPEDVG